MWVFCRFEDKQQVREDVGRTRERGSKHVGLEECGQEGRPESGNSFSATLPHLKAMTLHNLEAGPCHLLPVCSSPCNACNHLSNAYAAELGSNRNPHRGLPVSNTLSDHRCHSLRLTHLGLFFQIQI